MSHLIILVGILLMAGLTLLVTGWRGRLIDNHPVCAACRFDLVGCGRDCGRCPECGKVLTLPRAVQMGNRRRRKGMLITGMALTLLMFLGFLMPLMMNAVGLNWQQHMPTGFLLFHTSQWTGPAGATSQNELLKRIVAGKLTATQLQAFAEKVMRVRVDTRPIISSRGSWAYSFSVDWIHPPPTNMMLIRGVMSVELGGHSVPIANVGGSGQGGSGTMRSSFVTPDLPPGDWRAGVTFWFDLSSKGWSVPPGIGQMTFPVHVRVQPPGERSVKLVPDQSLQQVMEQCVRTSPLYRFTCDGQLARFGIYVDRPPANVAFDVYLRQGDRRWKSCSIGAVRDSQMHFGCDILSMAGYEINGPQVMIELPASIDAAEQSLDLFEIWDGKITIPVTAE